jgi:hypothetical protein
MSFNLKGLMRKYKINRSLERITVNMIILKQIIKKYLGG